jgi:hypothetical protein
VVADAPGGVSGEPGRGRFGLAGGVAPGRATVARLGEEAPVDGRRFDTWTRVLAASGSRRAALRRLLGGGGAGALALGAARRAGAQAGPAVCLPHGARCGPPREGNQRPCADCCSGFSERRPNGQRRCACRPDGQDCARNDQCCTGVCERGVCGADFVCDARSEPENCRRGVETNCAGGACACVKDVDGGNACVERTCTETPCASGADCGNRPCVRIPGCCGVNPFCGVPCGAGGPGGDGARSAGWR